MDMWDYSKREKKHIAELTTVGIKTSQPGD